jgi:hypothetical protein
VSDRSAISVLTLYDESFTSLAAISTPNKRRYAQRHGYDYLEQKGILDISRPPAWSKIRALLRHLADYDWIFWTDADSLIMNPALRLESFLDPGYDMVVSADPSGLNTGHFLLRRSDWSFSFLEATYRQVQFIHHPWWEQMAILHLLGNSPADAARVKILHKRELNSYRWDFRDGDFLVHFIYDPLVVRRLYMRAWAAKAEGPSAYLSRARRRSSRSSSAATADA